MSVQARLENEPAFCGKTLDLVALEDEAFAVSADAGVLFHLNATARQVLEAAHAGATFREISEVLADAHDLCPAQVLGDVTTLARGLEDGVQQALTQVKHGAEGAPPLSEPVYSATYELFGRRIAISYPTQEMAALCHPPLAPFRVDEDVRCQLTAQLKEADGTYVVRCGWALVKIEKSRGALMTALQRAILCHDVTAPGLFNVVVHAGAVVTDQGAWLVGGASGHGKSTLVTALDADGARVLSDDLVPLELDTETALPMPMALSVKEAGWQTAARFRPEISGIAPRISATGKKVKFLKPLNPAQDEDRKGHRIAGLLLPHRKMGATACLEPIGLKEAMVGLCDRFGRFPLDPRDLERLIALLERLPRYRLIYSEVEHILPMLRGRL